MSGTTRDIQQGDVYLFQTVDDGDISVDNGIVRMNSGLETMAYLCLFGGNQDDDGSQDSQLGWWGNVDETESSRKMISETQNLLDGLPITSANLKKIQKAAERDLQSFITERIASSVEVSVSMVGPRRVRIDIDIEANGERAEFSFTENWEFEVSASGVPPVSIPPYWVYTHCTDPVTYPDLILQVAAVKPSIRFDGECYFSNGRTDLPLTDPIPVPTHLYDDCGTCLSYVNTVWRRLSDDVQIGVLSPGHTDVDYAWPCDGGGLVRGYAAELTADPATNPTILKQCGIAFPSSGADLVGWPAFDLFDGVGCSSGIVGDTNWDIRWSTTLPGAASIAIDASRMAITAIANSGRNAIATLNMSAAHSGDFSVTGDLSNVQVPAGILEAELGYLQLVVGANTLLVGLYQTTGEVPGPEGGFISINGTEYYSGTTNVSASFSITRVGTLITISVDGFSKTLNSSSNVTEASLINGVFQQTPTGKTTTVYFDNFLFADGSGNPIYIDPTGKACT